MKKYLLHGKLTAKPDAVNELTGILLKAAEGVSKVKGCNLYVISKDSNDKNVVWITEIWDSKEDHDNSLKAEDTRALISTAIPLLDGQPERGQELEILGGTGI
jgi:quinol monooxygenase YgiN